MYVYMYVYMVLVVGVVCISHNVMAMFGYVEIEVPLRNINGDVKYAVGSKIRSAGEIWVEDTYGSYLYLNEK